MICSSSNSSKSMPSIFFRDAHPPIRLISYNSIRFLQIYFYFCVLLCLKFHVKHPICITGYISRPWTGLRKRAGKVSRTVLRSFHWISAISSYGYCFLFFSFCFFTFHAVSSVVSCFASNAFKRSCSDLTTFFA